MASFRFQAPGGLQRNHLLTRSLLGGPIRLSSRRGDIGILHPAGAASHYWVRSNKIVTRRAERDKRPSTGVWT